MSPLDEPRRRLLLVDGHAYAYRAFHAIRSLNAPDGAPTNAIYGFISMTRKLYLALKPSSLAVVWDGGLAAERMAVLPEYKAQRPPTPEALAEQLPQIEAWLDAHGWPQWRQEGAEADDWIATYARRAEAAGWGTVIASPDKDFMQLVGGQIALFNPGDKTGKLWGAADVEAKTGVGPGQIVDYLSLVGDAVDNIAGAPGVGPKTAADLLRRFGGIDGLLSRLMEVKADKLRADLLGSAEILRRNRLMIRLMDTLPGGLSLDQMTPRPADPEPLRGMYRRWGFRSLLAELESPGLDALLTAPPGRDTAPPPEAAPGVEPPRQGELFG